MKVLAFNRSTLDQLYMDDNEHRNQLQELKDRGWMVNPPLVHMFNPQSNEHKNVHYDDVNQWMERGFYAEPTYVYHPEEGKKMVSGEEARKLYSEGWYDSPAKFPGRQQGTMKLKGKNV